MCVDFIQILCHFLLRDFGNGGGGVVLEPIPVDTEGRLLK